MRRSAGEMDFTKVADSGAPFHAEERRTFIQSVAAGIPGAPKNPLTKQSRRPVTRNPARDPRGIRRLHLNTRRQSKHRRQLKRRLPSHLQPQPSLW